MMTAGAPEPIASAADPGEATTRSTEEVPLGTTSTSDREASSIQSGSVSTVARRTRFERRNRASASDGFSVGINAYLSVRALGATSRSERRPRSRRAAALGNANAAAAFASPARRAW